MRPHPHPGVIPYHGIRFPGTNMLSFALRLGLLALAAAAAGSCEVTFHENVEPILQKHCQECHRPGEIAPFSLLSYTRRAPLGEVDSRKCASKKMPPWFADPQYGHFANDRSLSKQEIDTLAAWVDGGAKEGDPKDAPKPRPSSRGGTSRKPDLVLGMSQPFHLPAKGEVPVSIPGSAHSVHRRPVDADGGSAAQRSLRRASRRGLRPRPPIQLASRRHTGSALRPSARRLQKHLRRR